MRPDTEKLIDQAIEVINKNKSTIVSGEFRKQYHRELLTVCELLAHEVCRLNRVINAGVGN